MRTNKYKLINVDTFVIHNPSTENFINDASITKQNFDETAFGKNVIENKIKNEI